MSDSAILPCAWKRRKVLEVVGFQKSKLWQLVKAGKFPAPLHLDGGAAWDSREVLEWQERRLEQAKAERDKRAAQQAEVV